MSEPKQKILVVRFSSLGDVILATPVFKNIKAATPDATVVAAVKRKFAGILDNNPNIDRVLALEEGESFWSYLQRVRRERFDLLIDLHSNVRSWMISAFAGIPRVVRYRKAALERRLFVKKRIRNPELARHTIDRYLAVLGELGIPARFTEPEIFPQGKPNVGLPRFLIVQTAFLGDAVLTTPLIPELRRAYPGARISVLCTPEVRDVFSGNQSPDEILVLDKRGKDRGPRSLLRWAGRLRGNHDIAIVPHRSFRSALLVWLAGIPKRIGFATSEGRMFLTDLAPFDWKMHDSERNLKLLEAMGIKPGAPQIAAPADAGFDFGAFCQRNGIAKDKFLVGMNAGSVWKTKQWLPERFAEVGDRLIEEWNAEVILFGSSRDMPQAQAVAAGMKRPAINLCGKTDLKTLAAMISRCRLFITNDSGPMHIASACDVPVVAIFGPTTRELGFFPYGKKSLVVELDLDCRPCSLHGGNACPLGHFKCMRDITADMVLDSCRKFLK